LLLREGIGWGYMPESMVREDLEEGGSSIEGAAAIPPARTAPVGASQQR